jgi:hypothetical protein
MRTVMNTQGLLSLVCLIVIFFLWLQTRNYYKGLSLLVACFALITSGSILIGLRDFIPVWVSVPLGNSLVVGGFVCLFFGLQLFVREKMLSVYNAIALVTLGVFAFLHS